MPILPTSEIDARKDDLVGMPAFIEVLMPPPQMFQVHLPALSFREEQNPFFSMVSMSHRVLVPLHIFGMKPHMPVYIITFPVLKE